MKAKLLRLIACAFALNVAAALAADLPGAPRASASSADATRAARLAWWHEAKFGLFIHWGLYSLPAGEWKGQTS